MAAAREETYSQSEDPLLSGLPEMDGYRLVGSCLLYGPLGKGGMGQVYKGRHLKFDLDVAVKCLHRELAHRNPQFVDRFLREAQVSASLTNENLIRVYETGEQGGVYYLVMEFVEGETAAGRVERKGRLAVEEALTILGGATRGLASAHRKNTVHRDIKPENILISYKGEVKLADLGLAKATSSDQGMTMTGVGLGTPVYMPPEQFRDFKSVGPSSDVYSMGATLYFLLTAKRPFGGESVHEIMHKVCAQGFPDIRKELPELGDAVVELVRRSTAMDPGARHRDAAELSEAIKALLAGTRVDIADPDAGAIQVPSLVSPPPAKTIARARLAVDADTRTEILRQPWSKKKKAATAAAAMLAVAALPLTYFLVTAGYFGEKEPQEQHVEPTTEKPTHVEEKVDADSPSEETRQTSTPPETTPESAVAVPSPQIQRGIDDENAGKLLDALNGFQAAADAGEDGSDGHMARVLLKLARRSRGDDPSTAVDYARRSRQLVPSADATDLETKIVADVEKGLATIRLSSPLALARPAAAGQPPPFLNSRMLDVAGTAEYPATRAVEIDGEEISKTGAFRWRHEFTTDGPQQLTIVAKDANGIEGKKSWDFIVDTMAPAVDLTPAATELPPGKHTLKGTVTDSSPCAVTVQGKEARSTKEGQWEIEVEIAEGDEEIVIKARDAAGNESPVVRIRIKTPWPKIEGLQIVRSAGGPPWVYSPRKDPSVQLILIDSGDVETPLKLEMGSDESRFSNEFPRHVVVLDSYLIGRFEITNAQYKRYCDSQRKEYPKDPYSESGYFENEPDKPVLNVTWDDATDYCHWLGATLPTEAQWEYAATAGARREHPWGSALPTKKKVLANFSGFATTQEQTEAGADERAEKRKEDGHALTAEVGFYEPGAFGIHEQAGNVSEWCRDPFAPYDRPVAAGTGLRQSSDNTDRRVHRGGSWASTASQLRSAHREYAGQTKASETIGFRVARDLSRAREE